MDPPVKEHQEKIKNLLSNPSIIEKILQDMKEQGIQVETPCLKLEVKGKNDIFELDFEDVKQVFTMFGEVKKITVIPYGIALVLFKDPAAAYFAWKSLNGKQLKGMNAKINVSWYKNQDMNQYEKEFENIPPKGQIISQNSKSTYDFQKTTECLSVQNQENFKQQPEQPQKFDSFYMAPQQYNEQAAQNSYSDFQSFRQELDQIENPINEFSNGFNQKDQTIKPSAKFTCKYEIQIPNDRDFQVARRIIGSKGANMKKIVDICTRDSDYIVNAQDIIKLRLRGKGSGYREGPDKKESDEPLHLCISSKYYDKYILACAECEFLLHQIYQDYRNFCKQRGYQIINLTINKQEGPIQNSQNDILNEYEEQQPMGLDKEQVEAWIQIRNNARRVCNYYEADRIREMLNWNGVILYDENNSTRWKFDLRRWEQSEFFPN